ncbi:MAG: tetratricopeptide repeat protein, partial [Veillonellales bacterium]
MDAHLLNKQALASASGEALQQAAQVLLQVVQARPDNANACNNLGLLLLKMKQPAKAETYFFQAIKHKPDSPEFHNNLGSLYAAGDKSREARVCFCRAITLNPAYAEAYRNLGLLLMRQNLIPEAQSCFCRAVELKPDYWQAHSVLGRIYLAQGQYAMGWEKYEWRLKSPKWHSLPFPQWQGENLTGKRILLYYEQGFGDTLQFVR